MYKVADKSFQTLIDHFHTIKKNKNFKLQKIFPSNLIGKSI